MNSDSHEGGVGVLIFISFYEQATNNFLVLRICVNFVINKISGSKLYTQSL